MSLATITPTVTVEDLDKLREARCRIGELERELRDMTYRAEQAERAWQREIGPPYRNKRHWIDAMVLTTQDRIAAIRRLTLFAQHVAMRSGDGDLIELARTALKEPE